MSGSLLGPDQIRKVNSTFPALVAHIRELLAADHTGLGLMKVHCMVESFDSDEMARIFRELSFISPLEKKALVRAAIYQLLAQEPALFVAPSAPSLPGVSIVDEIRNAAVDAARVFTPPQFKLNVTTSGAAETAKTDTKPEPKVTSTHESVVAKAVDEGNKRMTEQAAKLTAAVANLRESNTPKPIEIPAVPADATIPQE